MDENGTSLIMHQATTPIHHHGTAPPPAYSRLPPDGHEFPPNFCEPADLGTILIGGTSVGEPESRIFLEKKQLQYIDASNNTTTTKITKTAAATIATNNQSAGNNKNFNNSNNKSIIMTSLIETTTTNSTNGDTKPPPLPKSVPPPTAVTAATAAAANTTPSPSTRKIYREQLVVNIEAANVEDLKLTNQPRRSSSTLSLSSTPTSASGGSTPIIAQAREQPPDFRTTLRTTRKPSDWHKDEKSERSVRDKIAMFSMDDSGSNNGSITGSSPHLNMMSGGNSSRSGSRKTLNLSSENLLDATSNFRKPPAATLKSVQSTGNTTDYFGLHTTNGDIFATRALSMENLYAAPLSSVSSKQQQQQQMQQQLSKYSESMQSLDTMPSYYASLPRRHGMPQSQAQIERRTSFSGGQMSDEASRKVANLLEHRRRSITKLRGLVIPERPSLLEPILDLPEIKSRDSEQTTMSDYSTDSGVGSSGSATTAPRAAKRLETTPASNSAAYRSIFGTSTQLRTTAHNTQQPPAKPPRTSLAVVANSPMRPPVLLPHDESDSDSVFSSKVSSPPMSPMSANLSSGGGSIGGGAGGGGGGSSTISSSSSCSTATTTSIVPEKFALTRTLSSETNTSIASSTTSTLTSGSGSQASCSSVGSTPTVDLSRRIVKTSHSSGGGNSTTNGGELNAAAVAAAASRKNILASAKCRSGRGESSLLIRQRNQAPYHDDEDSTDGYDEEEVRRVAHKSRSRNNLANAGQQIGTSIAHATNSTSTAATSNSMQTSSPLINYKLISKQLATNAASALNNGTHNNNSLVDRVINVAAYVEVTTTTTASDTDDSSHKSDAANATSPSKISAIFIDEERKASFKAADDAIVVTAKPVKTTTVKTTAAPGVANAKPVKAVIAQQAAAPSSIQATKQMPPPKKSTIMASDAVDASSELQQWMAKSSAKINAAAAKLPEKSLKPVLAKFERSTTATSNTNTSNIGNSSAVLLSKSHAKPTTSTAELRERFERGATSATTTATTPTTKSLHALKSNAGSSSNYLDRFSSLDSVASSSSGVSSSTQNVSSTHEHNEFGSFSSLGSNQSLITAQDIQQIIEEADPPLKHPEAFIVVLQRDTPETTVGITLAGGANYETKEITVNKILADSPAARDGRLRKGDRILAVNGMSMRGLTHNESVSVLKTPRPEVTLVVTRSESLVVESVPTKKRHALGSLTSLLEKPNSDTQLVKKETRQAYHSASRSLDIGLDSVATTNETVENPKSKSNRNNNTIPRSSNTTTETLPNDKTTTTTTTTSTTTTRRISSQYQRGNSGELKKQRDEVANSNTNVSSTAATLAAPQRHVMVCKDNCGLGFSLDGGFDSPLGNRPLLIKKVFYGGAAHRTGQVKPGDEIAAINGLSTAKMTRIEVWNYMNQLPLGDVELVLV